MRQLLNKLVNYETMSFVLTVAWWALAVWWGSKGALMIMASSGMEPGPLQAATLDGGVTNVTFALLTAIFWIDKAGSVAQHNIMTTLLVGELRHRFQEHPAFMGIHDHFSAIEDTRLDLAVRSADLPGPIRVPPG